MKILSLICALALSVGVAKAGDCSWWHVPSTYVEGVCLLKIPAKAECNMGAEPFSSFLKQFNASQEFRIKRCKVSETTCLVLNATWLKLELGKMKRAGMIPLRGMAVEDPKCSDGEYKCYSDFGYWFDITRDRVIYNRCHQGYGEPDYAGAILLFERLGGRWYCTDISLWGKLDDGAWHK